MMDEFEIIKTKYGFHVFKNKVLIAGFPSEKEAKKYIEELKCREK